jgi:succinate dehydrogenase/fumarate reductase flavoprotein subunit
VIQGLFNLVVIGAGSAGMPCAIRAAGRGRRVLVIEKDTEAGGTLHLTAGHLSAAGTKRQAQKGIADAPANHYADIVRISRNTMDTTVAKLAVELAPAAVDWLDELGYPFHDKTPLLIYGHEPYSIPRTCFGQDDVPPKMNQPGKTVLNVLLPLWNQYIAEGKIELWAAHKMTKLEKNENTVTAVVVEDLQTGRLKTIDTTGIPVVLTTGGYAANPDFFAKVSGTAVRLVSTAKQTSTGDGIVAAMEVGGVFSGGEKHSSTLGGMELQPGSGRADFWGAWARVSNGVDRKQREIYVNERGERFMNEYDLDADERERIVLQQPGRRFWVVFDEKALHDGDCLVPQWTTEELKAEAQKQQAVFTANHIAGLARHTGLPPEKLLMTVLQYNRFVQHQKDEQFGRTCLKHALLHPPFYAVLVYAYSLISFGGIKVNAQLQVQQQDDTAFTNLYAAGEILGAAATSGHAFCGGMLLTPAISFGKWLGEKL